MTRGHYGPLVEVIIMNLAQNICLDDFLIKLETGSKTRSPDRDYSGYIYEVIIMNLAQNFCLDDFWVSFETGLLGVKN